MQYEMLKQCEVYVSQIFGHLVNYGLIVEVWTKSSNRMNIVEQ